MGRSFPSFFLIKKKGAAYGDFDSRMYPLRRCSPRKSVSWESWSRDNGYILQSKTAGASSFRLMAWSSSRFGGDLSASFSSNTLECHWYSSGICSAMAIEVPLLLTHALGQGMLTFPFSQSILGLKVRSQGYPNIIRSSPKLVL